MGLKKSGRYQHMYITLFGPRNETMLGEVNMTSLTLGRTADELSRETKHYDSKGAAYYICVVILVYALSIVLFLISLTRRKTKNKLREGGGSQIVQYIQNASSLRETGQRDSYRQLKHEMIARVTESPTVSSGTIHASHSRLSVTSFDASRLLPPPGRPTSSLNFLEPEKYLGPALPKKDGALRRDNGGYFNSGIDRVCLPDETITLVQVVPYDDATPSSADPVMSGIGGDRAIDTAEGSTKRCRWSIGPDGNIWILQLDGTRSFQTEDNENEAHVLSPGEVKYLAEDPFSPPGPASNLAPNIRQDVVVANGHGYAVEESAGAERKPFTPVSDGRIVQARKKTEFLKATSSEWVSECYCNSSCSKSIDKQQHLLRLIDGETNVWEPSDTPEVQKLIHVTSV